MVSVIKKEIEIEESLKKKIEYYYEDEEELEKNYDGGMEL